MYKLDAFIVIAVIAFIIAFVGFVIILTKMILDLSASVGQIFTAVLIEMGITICASAVTYIITTLVNSEDE